MISISKNIAQRYQLTDHLGNVRAVVGKATNGTPYVVARTDYYPFGMPMPGRNLEGTYRYKFQGQERDKETGMEAFELRLWDGRIGRWLTTDPAGQYFSPYLGMGNTPINSVDPDGGKFIRGTGITEAQFIKWQKMIEDVLGSDIYNFLENHEVPITVNFLKVPPAPGLHGQTTTFFKTSPEVVMYQAYNLPESTMRYNSPQS